MVTIPEGYRIETRLERICGWPRRLAATVGRRLLLWGSPRPAAGDGTEPHSRMVPPAQPEPAAPRASGWLPAGGGATTLPAADAYAAVAALSADGPRCSLVLPEEIPDLWPALEACVRQLRPRQDAARVAKAAASGQVALWIVAEPGRKGFAGALLVGVCNGAIRPLAATRDFAKRWPAYTPFAVVCETYRTPVRLVAPGLLSAEAMRAHQLHTLN